MKVIAILQARMGSTRLPGKVLRPILGKPMIEWMFRQLASCTGIDEFILATTTASSDDAVGAWAEEHGVRLYRGSEQDVLDRYYQAALAVGLGKGDIVVRMTCDCPLIQPDLCDRAVEEFRSGGYDYLYTGPLYAEGLDCEVMTFDVLARSWRETTLPSDREHVTLYIRERTDIFKLRFMDNKTDDGHYRVTVDEAIDFQVVSAIIEALYDPAEPFIRIDAVKDWLKTHPEVMALNSHVIRNEGTLKSLKKDGRLP
ncbi:MAG: NTP transferase domain-containing protein [Desulfovibrionaceae bacterium]